MAKLSTNEILLLIKKPKSFDKIEIAREHHNRLKLYSSESIRESDLGPYYKTVLAKIEGILPSDVFARFKQLIRVPLPYASFISHMYTELSKVFDSSDPFFKWEFKNPEYGDDYQEYRKDKRLNEYWKDTAVKHIKFHPDSFVVVDLPQEQTTPLPEPYFYLAHPDHQHDYEVNEFGDTEYLIIREGQFKDGIYKDKDKYLFIDSEKYVYATKDIIILEVPHTLGKCPAMKFCKGHCNPITLQLGNLDWLFFFEHAKRYLDLYGPFPVYSGYFNACHHIEDGVKCHEGYIGKTACSSCNGSGRSKAKLGVGTFVGVDPPTSKEDADLRKPIDRLDADIASVTWVTGEVERLYQEIEKDVIGFDVENNSTEAKNRDQISLSTESRKSKLVQFAECIERIQKFSEDVICKFRYQDNFISSVMSYGRDYYLKSASQLNEDYKTAKESGQPNFILEKKRDVIFSAEYRDNPDEAMKINILKNLEPWQDYTIDQCKALGFDQLYPSDFVLKAFFNTFIMQFEREVGSIVLFGSLLPFSIKINKIKDTLNTYVSDKLKVKEDNNNGNGSTNESFIR